MGKCDKYIRMVTSTIKTYRAYHPESKLGKVYKELITVRRVIRWEGKYENYFDIRSGEESLPMRLFKVEQIGADLVDEVALWMSMLTKGTGKWGAVI